jgi:hypothetical protein
VNIKSTSYPHGKKSVKSSWATGGSVSFDIAKAFNLKVTSRTEPSFLFGQMTVLVKLMTNCPNPVKKFDSCRNFNHF